MVAEVQQVLGEWRRAERLLRLLPPLAPERPEIEQHVAKLRALYRRLTDRETANLARLGASAASIEHSVALLDAVAAKYGLPETGVLDDREPDGAA